MVANALMATEERDLTQEELDARTGMTPERRAAIQKNMDSFAEYMHHVLKNLDELEKIPNGAYLIFDDDHEDGEKLRAEGYNVVYVKKVYEYS